MRIKIQGGTVRHGEPPLCNTCRRATIVRGRSLREEIVECGQLVCGRGRITFPVTFCTEFVDRQHPSIREMEDIAWVLRTDAKRNRIGFVRAKDLQPRERYVFDDELA